MTKFIFTATVPVLMYYFFKIVNFPTYKSIRPNNIKVESIPDLASLLIEPLDAIKKLVNINETYIQYVNAERDDNLIKCHMHPFVQAVHMAYAHHVPLTISPDMIWYLISSGAAQHINLNAEKLRKIFVNHNGKKKINIERDDFIFNSKQNNWAGVVDEFSIEINKYTNNNVADLIVANFSTTNNVSRTVSQLVLMDSMQKYFDYSLTTICGVPEIRLAGTKQDWELVKRKGNRIAELIPDLNVWINGSLNEILDHFINAFDDVIDKEFWNSIYKSTFILKLSFFNYPEPLIFSP